MVSGSTLTRTVAAAVLMIATACGSTTGPVDGLNGAIPAGPEIVIGAQDFSESSILAELYGQALVDAGYPVRQAPLGAYREAEISALRSGDINMAVEYAASLLEHLNGGAGEASADVLSTFTVLEERLATDGLQLLSSAPAQNTNVFVMQSERASALEITRLSDLAQAGPLVLGAPADCPTNPFCIPGLAEFYEVDLADGFVSAVADSTAIEALATDDAPLADAQLDIAVLFSTSPLLSSDGLVVLEDDRLMLAAENVTPVVRAEVLAAYGDPIERIVSEVSAELTTEELVELNRQFDEDGKGPADIATDWLKAHNFIG